MLGYNIAVCVCSVKIKRELFRKVIKSYLLFRMSECKHVRVHVLCEGKSCAQQRRKLTPVLGSIKEV